MRQDKQLELHESAWDFVIPEFLVRPTIRLPKYTLTTYLLVFIITGFLVNQFLIVRVNSGAANPIAQGSPKISSAPQSLLTAFDQRMIVKLRNENKPYPVLGTAHNHADIAVFLKGRQYDFAKQEYYMKSSFLHIDSNQNLKDAGSVLHMHAQGVPLSWFFESLGMKFTKDSLTLEEGEVLTNENGNKLKFYLNGKQVDELANHVFQPLDKLLISYGPENDPGIQTQINSVPNFARDHQK